MKLLYQVQERLLLFFEVSFILYNKGGCCWKVLTPGGIIIKFRFSYPANKSTDEHARQWLFGKWYAERSLAMSKHLANVHLTP